MLCLQQKFEIYCLLKKYTHEVYLKSPNTVCKQKDCVIYVYWEKLQTYDKVTKTLINTYSIEKQKKCFCVPGRSKMILYVVKKAATL